MITKNINNIIDDLTIGNVVGLPTETVYGLAANAFNEAAIQKIYSLKNRPTSNPLILHTHSIEEIYKYIIDNDSNRTLLELANEYWPGPLTILLEKNERILDIVTSGSQYVAFRIPNHPLILEILQNLPFPIAAPSANPYQSISPTTANQVYYYFGEKISYILDGGKCACGIESTIIGMEKNDLIIYRQGAITIEQLKNKIENVKVNDSGSSSIKTSGMSKTHYAPKTRMIIVNDIEDYIRNNKHQKIGVLSFDKMNMHSIAKNYYHHLYELDKKGYDIIITKKFINTGIGRALNDKIQRAISK
ncbi:MAG: L-threonylcarbamoyladenylate synthase [Chitinophagia bacterium]